jgi:hypothetical protein
VPRSAIGIDVWICRLGQRSVRLSPVAGRCGPIDRRPHQRMPEPHARAELDQPGALGRRDRVRSEPETPGRPPEHGDVAERLRSGGDQQPLRIARERMIPAEEALLDALRQRRPRKAEPSGQLRRRQAARELQQRERVATGLGDDRLADTLVQRPPDPSRKQQPCIVITKPIDDQLGQSPER